MDVSLIDGVLPLDQDESEFYQGTALKKERRTIGKYRERREGRMPFSYSQKNTYVEEKTTIRGDEEKKKTLGQRPGNLKDAQPIFANEKQQYLKNIQVGTY